MKDKFCVRFTALLCLTASACAQHGKAPVTTRPGNPVTSPVLIRVPKETSAGSGTPELAARGFVSAVLTNDRDRLDDVIDASYRDEATSWLHPEVANAPSAARIEGSVVVNENAGRARVIVSVVTDTVVGGSLVPPFACTVELVQSVDDGQWRVVAASESDQP